jgi:hypothetical protein
MLARCLRRLGSAPFVRSHSIERDRPHNTEEEAARVKKLTKSSPSAAHAQTKSHSLEPSDPSAPVSEVIRRRILRSGARFHCNDNISEFIRQDELPLLVDEVAQRMQGVLRHLRALKIAQPRLFTVFAAHWSSTRSTITTPLPQRAAWPRCSSWRRFLGATACCPTFTRPAHARYFLVDFGNTAQLPPSITAFPNVGYQSLCVLSALPLPSPTS